MEIKYGTHKGQKRANNQDYASVFTNLAGYNLAILADGMGGHSGGDVASCMVVEMLGRAWEVTNFDSRLGVEAWFAKNIEEANEKVYAAGQEDDALYGMGSTLVATALFDDVFVIGNVGDSRAYMIADNDMWQITEDHTMVNELLKAGIISENEAANHPSKNMLSRSIGMPPRDLRMDIKTMPNINSGYIMICSDGLTNMVGEPLILEIICDKFSVEEKVIELIEAANAAGGHDNITVMIIKFDR
ncbi:MAG: Stp1/IreP family PP2C-type Ser/Thr phosphatase [Lactobacillales bacterium]|jgi:protein phosphatase|nr:Stp1/IreP family PP2C-type Ser/Thr phosphatase [Lactobacillales bacterium]